MGQEFELKYAATAEKQALLHASYGPWTEIKMETTYFDTSSRALSAQHITLRTRLENGVSICTVKTPMPDGSRGEWECECGAIEAGLQELCRLGAPKTVALLAREGLQAVCGARFTRHACQIRLEDAAAELALDRGVLLGGGKDIPLCEVEVELKEGSRTAVTAFAEKIAAAYGLAPEPRSKFRRAMQLSKGE